MNDITFFKTLLLKEMDEATFTNKYNNSPKLKGGQKNLPDEVQAQIVKNKGEDHEVGIDPSTQSMAEKFKSIKAILKNYPQAKIKDIEKDKEQLEFTIVLGDMDENEYSELISALETAISENDGAIISDYGDEEIYMELIPPYTGKDKSKVMKEGEDHEVSMAHNSLKSIVSSASQLMNLLGNDEKDIPAWIQDHITNAENFISQASKNYHEYNEGSTGEHDMNKLPDGTEEFPVEEMSLQSMMEDLLEAKKKPSAGLTKKQKSNIVKKAKAGKDMGKKGKGFDKIVKAAEKSGARDPQAVAGAAFWKGQAKKAK